MITRMKKVHLPGGKLSQTAWCMRIPAATDTLNESTMPFIGTLQCKSDSSRASSLIPLPPKN